MALYHHTQVVFVHLFRQWRSCLCLLQIQSNADTDGLKIIRERTHALGCQIEKIKLNTRQKMSC